MTEAFVLQWHITHRCNLRCSHCYQRDYSAFSDRASMLGVLDQLEALLGVYGFRGHVNVTGGEPMLHPDFYWLLGEIVKRNMSFAVLTNGTALTSRDAQRLKALGADYVQISLDGCEKTHDKIRGEGSFRRAVSGIMNLRSRDIYTDVAFTAQSGNLGELKKLSRLCRRLGVNKLWFDRVIIPSDEDTEGLSVAKDDYERLCRAASRLNRRGLVSCARALQFLPCQTKRVYRCEAGRHLLALLADGSVMPCRRLPVTVGSVQNSDLLSIYRGSPLLRELRSAPKPQGCVGCAYSDRCFGGARCVSYAATGDWRNPDPDCPLIK